MILRILQMKKCQSTKTLGLIYQCDDEKAYEIDFERKKERKSHVITLSRWRLFKPREGCFWFHFAPQN